MVYQSWIGKKQTSLATVCFAHKARYQVIRYPYMKHQVLQQPKYTPNIELPVVRVLLHIEQLDSGLKGESSLSKFKKYVK